MGPLQGIAGARVIEALAFHLAEALLHMAAIAVGAEPTTVNVLVARGALVVRQGLVERNSLAGRIEFRRPARGQMAVVTFQLTVPPGQSEVGRLVIEGRRRFPGLLPVASEAIVVEFAPVGIRVAGRAARLESQPALLGMAVLHSGQQQRILSIGRVAGPALERSMLAGQGPAASLVLKQPARALLPGDQLEVTTHVLGMATGAPAVCFLPVQPSARLYELGNRTMAVETAAGQRLVAPAVTFETSPGRIQLLVRPRKGPGRELGNRGQSTGQKECNRQPTTRPPRHLSHPPVARPWLPSGRRSFPAHRRAGCLRCE